MYMIYDHIRDIEIAFILATLAGRLIYVFFE